MTHAWPISCGLACTVATTTLQSAKHAHNALDAIQQSHTQQRQTLWAPSAKTMIGLRVTAAFLLQRQATLSSSTTPEHIVRAASFAFGLRQQTRDGMTADLWFTEGLSDEFAFGVFHVHCVYCTGHSMGFNYNGTLRAPEVLLRATYPSRSAPRGDCSTCTSIFQHVDLIRRRETFETLYGNTYIPSDLVTSSMKLECQSRARL